MPEEVAMNHVSFLVFAEAPERSVLVSGFPAEAADQLDGLYVAGGRTYNNFAYFLKEGVPVRTHPPVAFLNTIDTPEKRLPCPRSISKKKTFFAI